MEYCCIGVIFLLAATFAVLGLVFGLQYRSRNKDPQQKQKSESDHTHETSE
jgi:preprotein translocase subunit SecG